MRTLALLALLLAAIVSCGYDDPYDNNGVDWTGDQDHDSFFDEEDNCPNVYNPDQHDWDGDGMGDRCDTDDEDGDGVADFEDNCVFIYNPDQHDFWQTGVGDACVLCPGLVIPSDNDRDGDRIPDECDNCPDNSNPAQVDSDQDGKGDLCDPHLNKRFGPPDGD